MLLSALVSAMETSLLLLALTQALFSIIRPKIVGSISTLCLLLPASVITSIFITGADSANAPEKSDEGAKWRSQDRMSG